MRSMFFASLIRSAADESLGIFTPLFLFLLGRSHVFFSFLPVDGFVAGVLVLIAYYALQRLMVLVLTFPGAVFIRRFGYVFGMVVGNMARIGTVVGFILAGQDPRWLLFSLIMGGIDIVFYWISHDTVFAQEVHKKEIGRDIGALAFLTKLLQIGVPALAGLIIVTFGYPVLFALACVLFVTACIPLFFLPHIDHASVPSLKELGSWLGDKQYQAFAFALVGRYMDILALLLWPVYVFAIIGQIERVGYIFSLVLFLSLVVTYVIGWYFDHKKAGKLFVASGCIMSLTWIGRLFVRGIWDIVGIEMVNKLASSVYMPCFDAFLCERSLQTKIFSFYVYREFLLSCIAIVLWLVALFVFGLSQGWAMIFVLGAIGILLGLFIEGHRRNG